MVSRVNLRFKERSFLTPVARCPESGVPPFQLDSEIMETKPSNMLEALDYWATKKPGKTALTFLDDSGVEVDSLTYKALRNRVDSLAAHLLEEVDLHKGSTCLLVYPPSLDFTVSYLACLRAGVIAVPCFPPDPKRLKKDLHMFTAIQGSSGAHVALTSRTYDYVKKVSSYRVVQLL